MRFKTTAEVLKLVNSKDSIRNICVIAHVDHGKTTMTDSLLAASGMLSPSVAGTALALDYIPEEQLRQMTIAAKNISLYHEVGGRPYIVNLIDTPGHIDFTGQVTKSTRAADGAVVVVDSVEEVSVQTEQTTRTALSERVRPILYINKVDRLVKELKLSPDQLQPKVARIIRQFNSLLDLYAEPTLKEKWKVDLASGTVALGSAKDRWGFTLESFQRKGFKISDVVDAYWHGGVDELRKELPLHEAILDMIVKHVPPPHVAQRYRLPAIWRGDLESEVGSAMLSCDEGGPIVLCVSGVTVDPQAGTVVTGRLFAGTAEEGAPVHLLNANVKGSIQQVCLYMGPYREVVHSIPAGNIPALLGLEQARTGETITSVEGATPFEAIRYVSEPVVTIAVEPEFSRDLPALVSILNKLAIEDPTLVTKVNEETGEYLLSGMGTLHLEIATTWIQKAGLKIVTSKPLTIYRESIEGKAGPFEVKSPNKLNRVKISVEALEPALVEAVRRGEISSLTPRKVLAKLLYEHGWDADAAKGVMAIDAYGNVLTDVSKGVQRLDQVKGSIQIGFLDAMREGPLAHEQTRGVKVLLEDAFVHVDPVHVGPAQWIPAVRRAIYAAMLSAKPILLEPIYKLVVNVPPELIGTVAKILAQKRGKTLTIEQRGHLAYLTGELPTEESFDLAEVLRGTTGGRAFWQTTFSHWSPVPVSLREQAIREIRKRKGLSPEPPQAHEFLD